MFDGREGEDEREGWAALLAVRLHPIKRISHSLNSIEISRKKKISPRPGRGRGRAAGIQDFLNIQRSEAQIGAPKKKKLDGHAFRPFFIHFFFFSFLSTRVAVVRRRKREAAAVAAGVK